MALDFFYEYCVIIVVSYRQKMLGVGALKFCVATGKYDWDFAAVKRKTC